MKQNENEKADEKKSQNGLEQLLEQKQSETEALKRLIDKLERMEPPEHRNKSEK